MKTNQNNKITDQFLDLTHVAELLQLKPNELQVLNLKYTNFDTRRKLLILKSEIEKSLPLLLSRYPENLEITTVQEGKISKSYLSDAPTNCDAWFIPGLDTTNDPRSLISFRTIIEKLFSPEGCPWDQEQTPQSLIPFFLEETYELIDAIETGNSNEKLEEIGDILAHIFMQTSIAQLADEFTLEDVVEYVSKKFIRRHPHVFGNVKNKSSQEIEQQWQNIKAAERNEKNAKESVSAIDSIPRSAPALSRAQQLLSRTKKIGLSKTEISIQQQIKSIQESLDQENYTQTIELLLWTTLLLADEKQLNAEQILRNSSNKYAEQFKNLELKAQLENKEISELSPLEHQKIWDNLI
ncbi:MAG: MazG family protein [Dehalococcoidia bacterium]|nr:MazG family protein [Dehalococcoidia bacterium]